MNASSQTSPLQTTLKCPACSYSLPPMTYEEYCYYSQMSIDNLYKEISLNPLKLVEPCRHIGENGTTGTTDKPLSRQEYLEKKAELINKMVGLKNKIHAK